jgi:multidrug efflux pump subunit AcrA (membrane-fusion protein)
MLMTINPRFVLPATGLLLTTGLIARSQSGEWRDRLRDWVSPVSSEASRAVESPPSPRVAAEGRVVAHDGAEVVVGTEVAGRIVRLTVKEKSAVRGRHRRVELGGPAGVAGGVFSEGRRGRRGHPIL